MAFGKSFSTLTIVAPGVDFGGGPVDFVDSGTVLLVVVVVEVLKVLDVLVVDDVVVMEVVQLVEEVVLTAGNDDVSSGEVETTEDN